jgi:hypothetical protein
VDYMVYVQFYYSVEKKSVACCLPELV